MYEDLSKYLWKEIFREYNLPLHKALLYGCLVFINSGIISLILILLLQLPTSLYVASGNEMYFYSFLVFEMAITMVGLLIMVRCLALNRHRHSIGNVKENIKNEIRLNSYVQFLWLSLVISPLLAMATSTVGIVRHFFPTIHNPPAWEMIVIFALLCILYIFGGYRKVVAKPLRFAPGTTNQDELGYASAAVKDMQRIVNSDKHILIANINGRLGEGKSSYLRMMVEARDQDEFLYTFISLTETNETKSFSKLFAERWSETICERYPSITSSAKKSIIDNIFRESGNGLMKVLRSALSTSRWPLKQTAVANTGDNYPEEEFVPQTIASLFSFVPYFKEQYWVIVIDEIERARFDEIYRTVETIERFRMESQWGLPIRLVFILCTDRIGFRKRVKEPYSSSSEAARLAYSFFEKEPKTIDMHIDLPPVAPDKMQDFIIKREKEWLIEKYGISTKAIANPDSKQQDDLKVYWLSDMINISDFKNGRLDDKKAHDLMIQYLLKESPRFIKKILEDTERFLGVFLGSGERQPDQIRLSDLIMLHYLKFKHPEALRFLYSVHAEVFPEFHSGFKSGSLGLMMKRLMRRGSSHEYTFEEYFKQKMQSELDEIDMVEIKNIVGFICYPVMEYVKDLSREDEVSVYEENGKPNYDRTLGLPENMWDALKIATEDVQGESDYLITQRDEIYIHENKKLPARINRSGSNLLMFARNMRRYYPGDSVVSRYLAIRIAEVLSTKRLIRRFPGSLKSETPYQNLLYIFTFHLANFLSKDEATDKDVDDAFSLVKQVLTSKDTMLEGKLVIINSLFVYSRSNKGGSFELDRARQKLEKKYYKEITQMIQTVMNKGLNDYLPRAGRSIYDYEENYFYTLYQMWSGDPNDSEGIAKIRKVASYKLEKYHTVIDQYWTSRFASSDTDALNPEFPIEVEDLIKITKKAGQTKRYKDIIDRWLKEPRKLRRPLIAAGLQDGSTTIRMQLEELKYLPKTRS